MAVLEDVLGHILNLSTGTPENLDVSDYVVVVVMVSFGGASIPLFRPTPTSSPFAAPTAASRSVCLSLPCRPSLNVSYPPLSSL